MRVVVDRIIAVKPGILRVKLYTVKETDSDVAELGADYEIALLEKDFTKAVGDNQVQIDLDQFQALVSKEVISMQNTAALASALDAANLEWEINTMANAKDEETVPNGVEGSTLAYGDNVSDESTDS